MTAKEEQGNRRLQVNMQADDAVLPPLTLGQMVKKLAEGQEQSQLDLHLTVERVKELETIVSQIGEQLRF